MDINIKNRLGSKLQSHTKYQLCASKLKNTLNFSNGPLLFEAVVLPYLVAGVRGRAVVAVRAAAHDGSAVQVEGYGVDQV